MHPFPQWGKGYTHSVCMKNIDHYALLGNPVSHTRSPFIHTEFARQTGEKIIYSAIHVAPDSFAEALTHFQAQGGKGVNITTPFKQIAFPLVDSMSERARQAGAINTIQFHANGQRFGDNTDGIGLVRDLIIRQKIKLANKRILILGAGGAARGILGPLLAENPSEIVIANRTPDKAADLVKLFAHSGSIRACSLFTLGDSSFDLVINATSAGLHGEIVSFPDNVLKNAFFYDIAYGQAILQQSKKQGARACCDGLGMLLEQAAESFYVWRHVRPETQNIFKILHRLT